MADSVQRSLFGSIPQSLKLWYLGGIYSSLVGFLTTKCAPPNSNPLALTTSLVLMAQGTMWTFIPCPGKAGGQVMLPSAY